MSSFVGGVHIRNSILLLFVAGNSYGQHNASAATSGHGHARRLFFVVLCCNVCDLLLCDVCDLFLVVLCVKQTCRSVLLYTQ